jgi:hypothetical protein
MILEGNIKIGRYKPNSKMKTKPPKISIIAGSISFITLSKIISNSLL